MLATLEDAAQDRAWGPTEEFLALQAELLHALLCAFIQANSDPSARPRISPLRIPRPGEKPNTIGLGALARKMTGRSS